MPNDDWRLRIRSVAGTRQDPVASSESGVEGVSERHPACAIVEASPASVPSRSTTALTKPKRHFTDLPPALDVRVRDDVLRVEGVGFVTRAMTEAALAPLAVGAAQPRVLVDLRDVSGYEAECVEVARQWLRRAQGMGVERIAFVANSSVVRTATEVVARHLGAPLRTFETPESAQRWLDSHNDAPPPATPTDEGMQTRPRA